MSEDKIRTIIIEYFKPLRKKLKTKLEKSKNIKIVGIAEDGENGLKLIEYLRPDIVLVGLDLTNQLERETTQIIKSNYPDTKLIILTSYFSKCEIFKFLGIGANAYCQRKFSNKILTAIKEVRRGRYWLDPKIKRTILKWISEIKEKNAYISKTSPKATLVSEPEIEIPNLLIGSKNYTEIAE